MSYGVNQPWGLVAVKSKGAASWNQQTNTYFIKSGYANNIFTGDPVCLAVAGANAGYIVSWWDSNVPNQNPIIGVFNGCSYFQTGPANVDPANPGRSYWPSGTVTPGNADTPCQIIDDPNTVFNVQTVGGSATQASIGQVGAITVTAGSQGQVNGNTTTGISSAALSLTGISSTTTTGNFLITRIVPISGNAPVPPATVLPFNNVEGMIFNHRFVSRPAGTIS